MMSHANNTQTSCTISTPPILTNYYLHISTSILTGTIFTVIILGLSIITVCGIVPFGTVFNTRHTTSWNTATIFILVSLLLCTFGLDILGLRFIYLLQTLIIVAYSLKHSSPPSPPVHQPSALGSTPPVAPWIYSFDLKNVFTPTFTAIRNLILSLFGFPTVEALTARLHIADAKCKLLESQLSGKDDRILALLAELQVAHSRAARKTAEVEEQNAVLEDAADVVRASLAKVDDLERALRDAQKHAKDREQVLKDTQAALATSRAETEKAESALAESMTTVAALTEQNSSLGDVPTDAQSATAEVNQAEDAESELMHKFDMLEAKIRRHVRHMQKQEENVRTLETQLEDQRSRNTSSNSNSNTPISEPSPSSAPSSSASSSNDQPAAVMREVERADAELARATRVLSLLEAKDRELTEFATFVDEHAARWHDVLRKLPVPPTVESQNNASTVPTSPFVSPSTELRRIRREIRALRREAAPKLKRKTGAAAVGMPTATATSAPTPTTTLSPASPPVVASTSVEEFFAPVRTSTPTPKVQKTLSQGLFKTCPARVESATLDRDVKFTFAPTRTSTPASKVRSASRPSLRKSSSAHDSEDNAKAKAPTRTSVAVATAPARPRSPASAPVAGGLSRKIVIVPDSPAPWSPTPVRPGSRRLLVS